MNLFNTQYHYFYFYYMYYDGDAFLIFHIPAVTPAGSHLHAQHPQIRTDMFSHQTKHIHQTYGSIFE